MFLLTRAKINLRIISMLIKKKILYFTIFFFCFNSFVLAGESENRTKYDKAQTLIDEYHGDTRQLKKALELIQEIAANNPNSKYALVGYGRLIYKAGYINYNNYDKSSLEKSKTYFEKAIMVSPTFFDAYFYGTYPYIFSKNYIKAKQMVVQAKNISPDSAKVDILSGNIFLKEKNYSATIKHAKLALKKSSDDKILVGAHSLLLKAYKKQKRYALAENSYLEIIKIRPKSPWSRINYSQFLMYRKNFDKSIEQGKMALELMDFSMGHKVLGDSYYAKAAHIHWKKKKYSASRKYFLLAIEHNPSNANAYYGLAMSYYRIGHKEKDKYQIMLAEDALEKAIEINSEHKQALEQLANIKKLLILLNKE